MPYYTINMGDDKARLGVFFILFYKIGPISRASEESISMNCRIENIF